MLSILLFMVLCVLQIMDITTTNNAIKYGGREANPIVKWCMEKVGNWWPAIKIPSIAIFIWWTEQQAWIPLLVATLVYVYVVVSNYNVYRKRK